MTSSKSSFDSSGLFGTLELGGSGSGSGSRPLLLTGQASIGRSKAGGAFSGEY
jgi:hypothetical protein